MKTRITLALCALISCLAWLGLSPSKTSAGLISAINNLTGVSAASVPASTGARICGMISAYTPATAGNAGLLRIANLTFTIAPNTGLTGMELGDICSNFCFDASGRITGNSNLAVGQGFGQICGIVTSYSASVGGVNGAVTIGGAKIRLAEGTYFSGQDQVAPGSSSCLSPVAAGDGVGAGSFFTQNSSPKQVRIPALVRGTTFGADSQEESFYLPEPVILTLDSDQASVFTVGQDSFGKAFSSEHRKVEGFSYSTQNSMVRALSCNESFWDMEFELAGKDVTEGDMVTFNLLNSNKELVHRVAMFTIQNGGAMLTSLHPDVKLNYSGMTTKGVSFFAPFIIGAGTSGLRTATLALAFNQSSPSFNGCYQLAVEIKRASGVGTTTVVMENVVVKRMERPGDRDVSIGLGLNGGMGWFPTGRVCDFVCWACTACSGSISGFVYCDTNNNGMKDAGEDGLRNVKITLSGSNGSTQSIMTSSDGSYQFTTVCGVTYKLEETQPTAPPVTGDGKDTAGNCGGDATTVNDTISGINVPDNANCSNYNFGERCTPCSGSISGFVYCDTNNNGMKDAGEDGLRNVKITLSGSNGSTQSIMTSSDGSYQFTTVCGVTYKLEETQPTAPPVTGDGKDTAGTCGGVAGNDVITGINVPDNANCINYNFGEQCGKCDTICWRSTQFFITNSRYLPGGTVLISGVNANNPVGIQQSLTAVKLAMAGGASPMQRINKQYVTAQLSLAYSGGGGSPVVFNTFWSPLTCSGIAFGPVTLSNGVTLAPTSLLDTLVNQTNLAIRENRLIDMPALADIWMLLNGRCVQ